jgi:tungstate transport system ATP-binding protein
MRQAMLFQRPVLLRRSCLDNVVFGLKPGSGSRTVKRDMAMRLLDQAGLGKLASKPARQLSGGEQQRLAIVRAMAREPELLFMDEPTASLDPASTNAIEQQIHAASLVGVTIVLVTHDAGQARRLADDVLFLQDGRLAESTAASSFFTQPESAAATAWLEGRLYLAQPPSGAPQSC